MNEEAFNMSIRKFLKDVGVTSQREIEGAIRNAVATGRLKGRETLDVTMTLELKSAGLKHTVAGKIVLE